MKQGILAMVVALVGATANASVIVDENFSGGQGSWAIRASVDKVVFADGVVKVSPNPSTGQPGAAYLAFSTVTLQDGQTLRMTVNVANTRTALKATDRDVRIGLGFADAAITGTSTTLAVPLDGYSLSAPSAGSGTDPRASWIDANGGAINFFNSATATVGDMALNNGVSIGTSLGTWVWEVTRSGSDLIFSGSLNGTAFTSTATATGANVVQNFQFNTVGLAYAYSTGEIATFDNLKIEVIPEPASLSLIGLTCAGLLTLRRLFI